MFTQYAERRAFDFVNSLKSARVVAFRNCWEGGMDYDTAIGCAGLADQPALRFWGKRWVEINEG